MLSTVTLLYFFGFFVWYNCSKKMRWKAKSVYLMALEKEEKLSKILVAMLFLLGCTMAISILGWMSGIIASICIIMCVGSLIVLIFPFRYLTLTHLMVLYFLCLLLEYTL